MTLFSLGIEAAERGWIPDSFLRPVISNLCAATALDKYVPPSNDVEIETYVSSLHLGPIAVSVEAANEQHYELPAEFFSLALGPRRKYSCCYFEKENSTLEQAEEAALRITCERAGIEDGQSILELGCGWGSLSLWMGKQYPNSRIVAMSNSRPQKDYIERQAVLRGVDSLRVITDDINHFNPAAHDLDGAFDRVVSIEMFEHIRNFQVTLYRISRWLKPQGKLFVHHFCHKSSCYPFETEGDVNWIGRHFFTGGIMPNERLLDEFGDQLRVTRRWNWNGQHYKKTADAWLVNLDAHRDAALRILRNVYGPAQADRWFQRWRMFFIAVSELFGFGNGDEWYVTHALLERTNQRAADH